MGSFQIRPEIWGAYLDLRAAPTDCRHRRDDLSRSGLLQAGRGFSETLRGIPVKPPDCAIGRAGENVIQVELRKSVFQHHPGQMRVR